MPKQNNNSAEATEVKKEFQNLQIVIARLDEKMDSTHKWVQSIDKKMDEIVPKLERHEETLGWLRWGVMGGIGALVGVVINAVQNVFGHKGP